MVGTQEEYQIQDLRLKTIELSHNLNFYGVLAIELFELLDGSILFNEIAPRPHNSFHWTMDGCENSQFDILIRTICGLPVKDVECSGKWEMTNLIGEEVKNIGNIKSLEVKLFSSTNLLDQSLLRLRLSLKLGNFPVIIIKIYF